jgi:hypothetical protein
MMMERCPSYVSDLRVALQASTNKHPGQVVLDANRVQRPREEVAAEKSRKQAEKKAKTAALKNAALKNAHIQIAPKEDTMAVEQRARLAGPAQLVRSRPRLVARKPASTMKDAATASSAETCKQAYMVSNITEKAYRVPS